MASTLAMKPDVDAVLRRFVHLRAGDGVAAGIRTTPLSNPDLPVHVLRSKRQMIAFDASDHATSQVLGIQDLGHELIVDIRYQQVRPRYRPMIFVPHHRRVARNEQADA
jgi:hypothetical protein